MKNFKKNIIFLILVICVFIAIIAVISAVSNYNNKNKEKIQIVATLFPQYDFAKKVGGDKVDVTLLLPPGSESHTYEPTPRDMVNINNSNLFIYTGKEMEPWANQVISGMKDNVKVLDLSTTVKLINSEEFEETHTIEENEHVEYNKEAEEHEAHEHEHHHEYDPHIWLNPQYAIKMMMQVQIIVLKLLKV